MSQPSIRVAAVQLEGVAGDLPENLRRLEQLVDEAVQGGATVVALPEFMSSPLYLGSGAERCAVPVQSVVREALVGWAQRYRITLGGSWLTADDGELFNRYHLAEPDGTVHEHDKDLPTMWEGAFYAPGREPERRGGRFETALGPVGVAVCWELIRRQTVQRLAGIGLAITGTHWWTPPDNWGLMTALVRGLSLFQYNRYLAEQAPVEFARMLGCPVLQASHCGRFSAGFLLSAGSDAQLAHHCGFVGHTQIVNAEGQVLAMRRQEQGMGVVQAAITLGARPPTAATPQRFWLPELPLFHRVYWHQQNWAARSYYARRGRAEGLAAAAR